MRRKFSRRNIDHWVEDLFNRGRRSLVGTEDIEVFDAVEELSGALIVLLVIRKAKNLVLDVAAADLEDEVSTLLNDDGKVSLYDIPADLREKLEAQTVKEIKEILDLVSKWVENAQKDERDST